jgi:hypothetical protein
MPIRPLSTARAMAAHCGGSAVRGFLSHGIQLRDWAVPAAFFLIAAVFVSLFHYRAPYFDSWAGVRMYQRWEEGAFGFADLFSVASGRWRAPAQRKMQEI